MLRSSARPSTATPEPPFAVPAWEPSRTLKPMRHGGGAMYDPRWDDVRERDDGRARVYDQRDRRDHDPRDGLMYDLDLPRGDARELVIDRDHVYELNGEDSRTLAAVGAFRVVPERDLERDRDHAPDHDTLDHLRDEGLIR